MVPFRVFFCFIAENRYPRIYEFAYTNTHTHNITFIGNTNVQYIVDCMLLGERKGEKRSYKDGVIFFG